MKKEIPALFQTLMVQAILEGRKTKTRRTKGLEFINEASEDFTHQYLGINEDGLHLMKNNYGATNAIKCPYGKTGDILWVRETWAKVPHSSYRQSNGVMQMPLDENMVAVFKAGWDRSMPGRWKPSIHMPKAAARIWLEVTDVRIERLKQITEKDAIAEGAPDSIKVDDMKLLKGLGNWKIPSPFRMHQFGFMALWCKINGCESWLQNPWVWVVSFKVLSTTGKPEEKPQYKTLAKDYDFNCRTNLQTSHY